jgi:hypothetical protein
MQTPHGCVSRTMLVVPQVTTPPPKKKIWLEHHVSMCLPNFLHFGALDTLNRELDRLSRRGKPLMK